MLSRRLKVSLPWPQTQLQMAGPLTPLFHLGLLPFVGPGGKGSTRLHMDMADAVNIMLHTSPPLGENVPLEHAPGVAAWDIFRAEDADKIRAYLREWARKSKPSWIITDDPIHTHAYYIDSGMRKQLWREYGVRSWRIYQRQGEAIFIPAGCAHQVRHFFLPIDFRRDTLLSVKVLIGTFTTPLRSKIGLQPSRLHQSSRRLCLSRKRFAVQEINLRIPEHDERGESVERGCVTTQTYDVVCLARDASD